jgi:hypothetical protein
MPKNLLSDVLDLGAPATMSAAVSGTTTTAK